MNPEGILHHPTIFKLGPVELTGFGLAVLAGFAIAQIVAQRELWRRGQELEANAIPDVVMAALIGTLTLFSQAPKLEEDNWHAVLLLGAVET